jgi:DNA-binding MarR family transcriptional regulator
MIDTSTRSGMNDATSRWTSQELATWRALMETTGDLRRILGAQLAEECGVSAADYQVLLALSEAEGHRLRSSELAASMDWERSRLSHQLARMDKRGLVAREACATDKRGAEVVLTAEGLTQFRACTMPHLRAVRKHFADALTPAQFAALADILGSLRRHLRPEDDTP